MTNVTMHGIGADAARAAAKTNETLLRMIELHSAQIATTSALLSITPSRDVIDSIAQSFDTVDFHSVMGTLQANELNRQTLAALKSAFRAVEDLPILTARYSLYRASYLRLINLAADHLPEIHAAESPLLRDSRRSEMTAWLRFLASVPAVFTGEDLEVLASSIVPAFIRMDCVPMEARVTALQELADARPEDVAFRTAVVRGLAHGVDADPSVGEEMSGFLGAILEQHHAEFPASLPALAMEDATGLAVLVRVAARGVKTETFRQTLFLILAATDGAAEDEVLRQWSALSSSDPLALVEAIARTAGIKSGTRVEAQRQKILPAAKARETAWNEQVQALGAKLFDALTPIGDRLAEYHLKTSDGLFGLRRVIAEADNRAELVRAVLRNASLALTFGDGTDASSNTALTKRVHDRREQFLYILSPLIVVLGWTAVSFTWWKVALAGGLAALAAFAHSQWQALSGSTAALGPLTSQILPGFAAEAQRTAARLAETDAELKAIVRNAFAVVPPAFKKSA